MKRLEEAKKRSQRPRKTFTESKKACTITLISRKSENKRGREAGHGKTEEAEVRLQRVSVSELSRIWTGGLTEADVDSGTDEGNIKRNQIRDLIDIETWSCIDYVLVRFIRLLLIENSGIGRTATQ